MLTYEECLDMCDLTSDEVDAIAEHEHVDPIIALAFGQYMINHEGEQKIKRIILDDIEKAHREGNRGHEALLQKVLEHFIATHPDHDSRKSAAA
ncbi:hypothetical protein [Pontibacterium sp.]|uniref:hypothetical protein n=1 Tax=Pontibacterium sp. TaxID=2036026 RepID=UPI003564CC67